MFSIVDGKTIDMDTLTHFYVKAIASTEILWRDTYMDGVQYYYAESELYILRQKLGKTFSYFFINARSPREAADNLIREICGDYRHQNFSAKCAYCGKPYRKKKKAQRFCSIKCKDKWWNRERAGDREYLHPQCEDNFNGEW